MYYLITTTINFPKLLKDYSLDAHKYNQEHEIIVIGDLKTPLQVAGFCESLPNCTYLGPEQQQKQFGHLPIYEHLPFNSVQRRNLAYIYCLQKGIEPTDVLVTIDDDNFLKDSNYLGLHSDNLQSISENISAKSPTWFNPLELFYKEKFVPRGYSAFHRFTKQKNIHSSKQINPIAVNAGLWEKNPDVDALTNLIGLSTPYKVTRSKPICLGKNILCPFNTQNTAYLSNFWLTAFLSPYLGRYDDIFSSYITKRISDHHGYSIRFGGPVVIQDRNQHDFYDDLRGEIHGLSTTDSFVELLYNTKLTHTSLLQNFVELADAISAQYSDHNFDASLHNLKQPWSISKMAEGMKIWIDTLDKLKITSHNIGHHQAHAKS